MKVDLKDLSLPQLHAIKDIIQKGIVATAEKVEKAAEKSYLCHKSPPAGYPTDKESYADPSCYRYPINTKSRCLAAWRYVHQGDNKSILGDKFSAVESKIKSYAKKHYNLDLQTGGAEQVDWAQVFIDYYDGETMGDENKENAEAAVNTVDIGKLQKEIDAKDELLKGKATELEAASKSISELSTKVEGLTKQLEVSNKEVTELKKFKEDAEKAAARSELLKNRKTKIEEAGVDVDIASDADKWLNMSDEMFDFTVAKLTEVKKTAKSSIKVPDITKTDDLSNKEIVKQGFNELKKGRK